MQVKFLGVGEAFEENYPNSSYLIISKTRILLDCGYSVPAALWKYDDDQELLDAVYLSHPHADHYFGMPALLGRMKEERRKKKLAIICQKDMVSQLKALLAMGYRGFAESFDFPVEFIGIDKNSKLKLNEFTLTFAPTIHAVENLAVRVQEGKKSVCYSGDGQFTEGTEQLYKNCDLLIHEAYTLKEEVKNHACISDCVEMAERIDVKKLALVHIRRDVRKKFSLRQLGKRKMKVILPKDEKIAF